MMDLVALYQPRVSTTLATVDTVVLKSTGIETRLKSGKTHTPPGLK